MDLEQGQLERVRATMPIPESVREELYTGVWDLALSGTMHTRRGSFGDGALQFRRHGLVILWMTACALRFLSELRRLEFRDLGPDSIYVARSKRGKSGTVSVVPKLIAATVAWRSWYVASTVASEPAELLPSIRGGPLTPTCSTEMCADRLASSLDFDCRRTAFATRPVNMPTHRQVPFEASRR